jgi:ubiquinone/menaquinone biosynthesis C-methylase UbiE
MNSILNSQHEKILQVQKEAWNKSSAGWKKWDQMMMEFLEPFGSEMIRMLNLKDDAKVLDVGTGTGEPGLTIASIVKNGSVTATDLSEEMLNIANEHARARGLINFSTVSSNSEDLPFEDDSFDAVTCRFSFMFFPDMSHSLAEMVRVLKPGGKVAAAVWNSGDKNFWVSNSMEIMIRMLQLNPPVPGGPGIFRCAQLGMMADLFRNTGLKDVEEREIRSKLSCSTVETYWNFITEAASPVAFSKAEEPMKAQIKESVIGRLREKCGEGNIALDSSATIICGKK